MDLEAKLMKRGENVIWTTLRRAPSLIDSGIGLTVTVKVHPAIEDFVRSLGTGEELAVRTYGRHWIPLLGDKPFLVHDLAAEFDPGVCLLDSKHSYTLNKIGWPISEQTAMPHGTADILNLSFIRLVGASEGAGVRFGIRGVFTLEATEKLARQIEQASKAFYIAYMKPIDITVVTSIQETNL